jgi:phage FluMu protein Com
MSIEIPCTNCSKTLRIPESAAGKKARCPECGGITSVPAMQIPSTASSGHSSTWEETWYVRMPSGDEFGPVSRNEINRWMNEGRLSVECLLRKGENAKWQPASETFPTLASNSTQPTSSYAASTQAAYSGSHLPQHRGGLIFALALIGWLAVPLTAPIAWLLGSQDLKAMARGQMDPQGEGLTRAGMWLGAIQTILIGLALLAVVAFILFIILVAAANG